MIDRLTQEKIEKRAFEIYEWRVYNNVPGCSLSDWLEAESDVIIDRRKEGCPKCGCKLLGRKDDTVICLSCTWSVIYTRQTDKDLTEFRKIKLRVEEIENGKLNTVVPI